jgi:hypothetical protein
VIKNAESEAPADNLNPVAGSVTDKRGYGDRVGFSIRTIDNFLADGMPHLKVGQRRVRIFVDEADAWMKEKFHTRRIGPLNGGARENQAQQ